MLALLSPAKKLDTHPLPPRYHSLSFTRPEQLAQSELLMKTVRALSAKDIAALMTLSPSLAELNFDRFQTWKADHVLGQNEAKPAVLTFAGEVYSGLNAWSLKPEALQWLNQHVLILSGLYGYLRPLDLMQPYRLEMGTKLANPRGKDLYAFWGTRVADMLNRQVEASSGESVLINLASSEYFKVVTPSVLKPPVFTMTFKEIKAGKPTMLMVFAKRARGLMARFMAENQIDKVSGLKDFNLDDYRFDSELSSANEFVFTRPYRSAKGES